MYADGGGGASLLPFSHQGQLVAWCVVEPTGIPPGDEKVRDLDTFGYPAGNGARGAKIYIVRMGEYGECASYVGKWWCGGGKAHES
ncbi:hypothetical protein GCM10027280_10060 [Micromonospora polyrhachis]